MSTKPGQPPHARVSYFRHDARSNRHISFCTLTCATTHPPRFTDEWKARLRHPRVPREALPPALKRAFDAGEVAKERFRRASSLGPGLPPLDTDKGSKAKVTPDPA